MAEAPLDGAPLGRLECDAFCTCGYNLYRQAVVRDARLDVALVRCPECGRWHPAGHGATAASVWMTRLAKLLLVAWILLLLVAAAVMVLIQMAFNLYAHDQVLWGNYYSYGYGMPEETYGRYVFFLFPFGMGVFAGLIQAVGMWHLRFLPRLVPMLLILGSAAFFSLASLSGYSGDYQVMAYVAIIITSGVTALGWIVTAAAGRAPARWLALLLVPPGPRQYLAFLWHADGREPPGVCKRVDRP
jgi:hypothetical protein